MDGQLKAITGEGAEKKTAKTGAGGDEKIVVPVPCRNETMPGKALKEGEK